MHTIQYRLLMFVLACVMFCSLLGCGNTQVSYITADTVEPYFDTIEGDHSVTSDCFMLATASDVAVATIPVYVCGAVNAPGVYYLPAGSLKKDALDMADGFAEDASREYVNLAETVSEGEQIYFPTLSEIEAWNPIYNILGDSAEDGRIAINSATKEQLMTLPGIGESKAEAIISYREQHGAFNKPEDLLNVSGIKDGVYQRIKDYIVVD